MEHGTLVEVVTTPRYKAICNPCGTEKYSATVEFLRGYMTDCAAKGHKPAIYDTKPETTCPLGEPR